MAKRFSRFLYQPCVPLGEDGRRVTASEAHIALSRRAATEGMVLLKNEGGALPLKYGESVALFGVATVDYVKGGGGSGAVYTPYVRNIYDGMRIKEEDGKIKLFKPLADFYTAFVKSEKARNEEPCKKDYEELYKMPESPDRERAGAKLFFKYKIGEPEIPQELFDNAAAAADTAIITISRFSSEGWDRNSDKGDFYLTDSEQALADRVCASFKKVIAVLDVGGMIDTKWFAENNNIQSALLAWQAGTEGGLAVADILCGDVNPSGKLTDTFAKSFDDYPSSSGFNDSDNYVDYNEDIYVGYRYFETIPGANKKVNYPFGYGLSYTTFEISGLSAFDDGSRITVTATVKNTGNTAGKEVVQVYYGAPQGVLGKPKKQLATFKKTRLLNPGEEETLALSFKAEDMASFDDLGKLQKSAYLLEKGDYKVFVGTSVSDCTELEYKFTVNEEYRVINQLESRCAPIELKSRMTADGSMEQLPAGKINDNYPVHPENTAKAPEKPVMFDKVGTEITLDEFLAQFTDEELTHFVGGNSNSGVSNTWSFGGLSRLGVPLFPTADGPAGLRLFEDCGIPTTAWPCATLLACSWNTELVYEIGVAGASEVKENNIAVWLTPALNIHRSPLCGRNFEYFSEDPLIAGKMAAALINGMQSQKVAASAKHFACNNKEINRVNSDSRVSERALREIYLKGFEICVKEAQPWTIMTSYNLINGVHTSESHELLDGILRKEWGFKGMITTDWGRKNDPVKEVKAGNDVKMHIGYPDDLAEALKDGRLTRGDLEACVRRMLNTFLNFD